MNNPFAIFSRGGTKRYGLYLLVCFWPTVHCKIICSL